MTLTPETVREARSAAAGIAERLTAITEVDHPLEREQRIDSLKNFITPTPGHNLVTVAHQIVAADVARTRQAFLAATEPFYFDADKAGRAADECQAITALQHRHSLLSESPSVGSAQLLLRVFNDFLASSAAAAVPNEPALEEESTTENPPAAN